MKFAEIKNEASATSGNIVVVSSRQLPSEESGREKGESNDAVCCQRARLCLGIDQVKYPSVPAIGGRLVS